MTLSTILDIFRIFSAQAVLVGHLLTYHKPLVWLQNGAVLIFFFLSGFCIASRVIQMKQDKLRFSVFLKARARRIYLVFLPALLLVLMLDGVQVRLNPETYRFVSAFNLKTFIANIFMLQYWPSIPFGSARPFWTLPLLWWNYLVFGWLMLESKKLPALFFGIIPLYSLFFGRGVGLTFIWWLGAGLGYLVKQKFLLKRHKKSIINFFSGYSLTLYLTHYSIIMFFREQLINNFWLYFWCLLFITNLTAIIIAGVTERKYFR